MPRDTFCLNKSCLGCRKPDTESHWQVRTDPPCKGRFLEEKSLWIGVILVIQHSGADVLQFFRKQEILPPVLCFKEPNLKSVTTLCMEMNDHLSSVIKASAEFLHKYSWIHDYKVTRLLADDVLGSIPSDWRVFLLKISINEFNNIFLGDGDSQEFPTDLLPASVKEFVRDRKQVLQSSVVEERELDGSKLSWCQKRGVKAKKEHEVVNLASLVAEQCQAAGVGRVVDIGCGLGYLGEELQRRGLQVFPVFFPMRVVRVWCAGNWN